MQEVLHVNFCRFGFIGVSINAAFNPPAWNRVRNDFAFVSMQPNFYGVSRLQGFIGIGGENRSGSHEFGIVPLGMPLIAGHALLTALLILVDTVGVIFTLISLVINLAIVALALCQASRVARLLGNQGLRGVSKLIALLLAAIAVSLIRRGWQATG